MESWAALRRHNQGLSPAFDFQNEVKADIRIPIIFMSVADSKSPDAAVC